MPGAAGAQDLLDGAEQAVTVVEHGAIELLALGLLDGAGLQGFQVQADGGDRGLQLMRDRVDKRVVLGVAPNLAHQKGGVENYSGDH